MRIGSQNVEMVSTSMKNSAAKSMNLSNDKTAQVTNLDKTEKVIREEGKDTYTKEQLETAISTVNELLDIQHKSSKFVFHEGLDKYFVRLVDSETDELIKEIPPERLLDAFYQMQKMAGMIVDEKI